MKRSKYKEKALAIFIKPPSAHENKNRLIKRSTENAADLTKRLEKFNKELSFAERFDVVIENKNLDITKATIKKIVLDFIN